MREIRTLWAELYLLLWNLIGGWGLAVFEASARRGAWDLPPNDDPDVVQYLTTLDEDERQQFMSLPRHIKPSGG